MTFRAIPILSVAAMLAFAACDEDDPTQVTETRETVTLAFQASEGFNVLPGMTAKASIDVPSDRTGARMMVPARAVARNEGDAPYVWRIDPEAMTVSRAEVGLGELTGEEIEITRGLAPGDQIAVSGVHQLRDGMAVRRFQ